MSKKLHREFLEIASAISSSPRSHSKSGAVQLRRSNRDACLATRICRAVVGQQLSTAAANTIWGRVVELAPVGRLTGQDFTVCLEQVDDEAIRACGVSRAKVKAIRAILTANKNDQLNPAWLSKRSQEERMQTLTDIWGVGQWTADMINMFYFGDKDVWPQGDLTVVNTLRALVGRRRSLEKTALKFAPHRSYLALYMYRIADTDTV